MRNLPEAAGAEALAAGVDSTFLVAVTNLRDAKQAEVSA